MVAGPVRAQAQGTDDGVMGRAGGHVRAFVALPAHVALVADGAGVAVHVLARFGDAVVGAAEVVPPLGEGGHHRCQDEGDERCGKGRIRLQGVAERR